jgi:hypothetical protein
MIVAPPGSFKTTAIETACEAHSNAIVCSDMNVAQWLKVKDEFVSGRYSTLGFPEFEKLYQRHASVASNIEGIIRALVSEGFGTGPGGDPRMPRLKARALVIGGMTTNCFERHYEDWQKSGFLRRFIWLLISVRNPDAIVESIRKWERLDFGKFVVRPANRQIKVEVNEKRSRQIENAMKSQAGLHGTAYVLFKKIVSVLEWKYNGASPRIDELIREMTPALSKDGGRIVLGEQRIILGDK